MRGEFGGPQLRGARSLYHITCLVIWSEASRRLFLAMNGNVSQQRAKSLFPKLLFLLTIFQSNKSSG
ncbi:hypothetical protein FocnCong_v002311 [Fusarium oxysporum f. sp. conglutinans]|nr:hypothetical protein FocnCong_v002311 [Fusarium oxysporum f. sp. conglutinans]